MLPIRQMSEEFGAKVEWIGETQEIVVSNDGTIIKLKIGDNKAFINGEEVLIDVNPLILNSRTYVLLRFILEAFDKDVIYNDDLKTIEILEKTLTK